MAQPSVKRFGLLTGSVNTSRKATSLVRIGGTLYSRPLSRKVADTTRKSGDSTAASARYSTVTTPTDRRFWTAGLLALRGF